jgi:transcriptional regulator
MAPKEGQKLLHGALETLILQTLADSPRHGYAIARSIEERSGEAIKVEEGSLYPGLYRMERKGLLEAEWGVTELDRRAKFYRLTPAGRARLRAAIEEWDHFSAAVAAVLRPS